jgi:hypothetical protein
MARIAATLLTLGLTVFLPASASPDVPKAIQPEMASQERARLRRAITQVRAMLAQMKDPRACMIPEEVRATERLLENMEWAYAHHMESLIKLPKR